MATLLTLAQHTLAAELVERSIDAMFDDQFAENGSFVVRRTTTRDGVEREYFYYIGYRPGGEGETKDKRYSRYVGPADDPAIADRVAKFKALKTSRKESASIVSALAGAGLVRPPIVMGRMIEAIAKAGAFRLGVVLIGTAAYQTYPILLGHRLPQASAQTGDLDIAQFKSVSIAVDDRTPPLLDVLKSVDPTFAPIPHVNDPVASTVFANAAGFRLDVIAAHRGSDDDIGKPQRMPALSGAAAEPLRFIDYLIHKPQRSVALHGAGIAVNVPAPERYALHKLIISGRRRADAAGQAKARKDVAQAGEIIEALESGSRIDALAEALEEALTRGPKWRAGIASGARTLPSKARQALRAIAPAGLLDPKPDAAANTQRRRKH